MCTVHVTQRKYDVQVTKDKTDPCLAIPKLSKLYIYIYIYIERERERERDLGV